MKGFVIFWLASVVLSFAILAAVIWVLAHFVAKFW